MRPTNPRWRTAAILKNPLHRHIAATVWPILINLAQQRTLTPFIVSTVKIYNFSKSKMEAATILKITKLALSAQRFDQSLQNFIS